MHKHLTVSYLQKIPRHWLGALIIDLRTPTNLSTPLYRTKYLLVSINWKIETSKWEWIALEERFRQNIIRRRYALSGIITKTTKEESYFKE